MQADRLATRWQRPQWVCAGLALLVTLVFGGLGGGLVIASMYRSAVEAMRQDAKVYGESVARTIAAQYAKAAQFEIALEAVPGTPTYLARLMQETPGVTRIALTGPARQTLHSVGAPADADHGLTETAILANDRPVGYIQVAVDPNRLADQVSRWFWVFGAGVLCLAVLASVLVWYGPGADLQRRRQRLMDGLENGLVTLPDSALREYAGKGHDPLDAALQALVQGEESVREQLAGFESLAQELLAVDFDDRQAPEIERLRSVVQNQLGIGAA